MIGPPDKPKVSYDLSEVNKKFLMRVEKILKEKKLQLLTPMLIMISLRKI